MEPTKLLDDSYEAALVEQLRWTPLPPELHSPLPLQMGRDGLPTTPPVDAPGNVMGPWREVMTWPPPKDACHMPLAAAAALYKTAVRRLDQEGDPGRQRQLHYRIIIGLTTAISVLHQDASMLARFQLLNMDTLRVEESAGAVGWFDFVFFGGGGQRIKLWPPGPRGEGKAAGSVGVWFALRPLPLSPHRRWSDLSLPHLPLFFCGCCHPAHLRPSPDQPCPTTPAAGLRARWQSPDGAGPHPRAAPAGAGVPLCVC